MNLIFTIVVTLMVFPFIILGRAIGALATVAEWALFPVLWWNILYCAIEQRHDHMKMTLRCLPWWRRPLVRFQVPYRALWFIATHDMGAECRVYDGDGQLIADGQRALTLREILRGTYVSRAGNATYFWWIKTPFGKVPFPAISKLLMQ